MSVRVELVEAREADGTARDLSFDKLNTNGKEQEAAAGEARIVGRGGAAPAGLVAVRSSCAASSRDCAVARVTGLEPATSGVTGRRSNQLSYTRIEARPAN